MNIEELAKQQRESMATGMIAQAAYEPMSIKDTNGGTIKRLEQQLKDAKELQELLERNPDFERIVTLFQRTQRGF